MSDLTLFLDGSIEVASGGPRSVGGKKIRPIAVHTFIANYLATNPVIAASPLAIILAAGNVTNGTNIQMSNGDVLKAVNGGSQLNLRDGANNQFGLTSDAGAYGESFVAGTATYQSSGFANNYFNADADGCRIRVSNTASFTYLGSIDSGIDLVANIGTLTYAMAVADNTGGAVNFTSTVNKAVTVNSGSSGNPTVVNTGVDYSAPIGGVGITVKTNNSAYCNKLAINQSGSSYETVVSNATLTADRTATFPDASGTVGLVRYVAVNTPTVHTATTGEVVAVTTGAGALVVNLPSAAVANQMITIKKVDNGAGAISLTPAGGDTIDGVAGVDSSLSTQWKSMTLVSNGVSNWLIIATV